MANITLDKMKTIVQSIVASVTRYKPNLSVNDPDDPRYVAGRLCYKAKKTVEEVPETTVTFAENNGLYTAELTSVPGVQAAGDVRTVVWDGVAYVCKAGDYGGIGLALGNRSLYNAMAGESNPDTGEPFVWTMMPQHGISVLATKDTAETHPVSCWADKEVVHTLPKEYLPQIPTDKLPDLGLAPVATSGSYNDLLNKPTIPTVPSDIVRYNTTQDLTTAQKTQARTNIGAGTSSFDGAYSSLTGAPTLATVATSGSYNDLDDRTHYEEKNSEVIAEFTGYWDGTKKTFIKTYTQMGITESLFADVNGTETYDVVLLKTSDGETVAHLSGAFKSTQYTSGYKYYCYAMGNRSLLNETQYKDLYDANDTGEEYCIAVTEAFYNSALQGSYCNITVFAKSHASARGDKVTMVRNTTNVKKLDDIFIPSTIQRVGQPLYLTDSAGAKWHLVVGTDGTLSATAVTEEATE